MGEFAVGQGVPRFEDPRLLKGGGRYIDDVVLPGMNGRQISDAAKAIRPDIRVLFTTGFTRNAIVHHGRLDSGVALLQKPLSQEVLARKVREMLGAPQITVRAMGEEQREATGAL